MTIEMILIKLINEVKSIKMDLYGIAGHEDVQNTVNRLNELIDKLNSPEYMLGPKKDPTANAYNIDPNDFKH